MSYGGSMPSGWMRWLFEQFEFPFKVVYSQELDAGGLNAKYDDIVFADGVLPNFSGPGAACRRKAKASADAAPTRNAIPAEFRPWLGRVSADKTLPQLKAFVMAAARCCAIGGSSRVYAAMKLPVHDALTEVVKGKEQPVPAERFYVPGSLLKAQVDNTQPVAYGMPSTGGRLLRQLAGVQADSGCGCMKGTADDCVVWRWERCWIRAGPGDRRT